MISQHLEIVPIIWREANTFVRDFHRHSGETKGSKFCVSIRDRDGKIRGVGIAGRPVAKALQDGRTFEITRNCTDGSPNACSMIYGSLTRAAKALGYKRGVTYTLASEPGTSLRAAGWRRVAFVKAQSWSRPSRTRDDKHDIADRARWEWP